MYRKNLSKRPSFNKTQTYEKNIDIGDAKRPPESDNSGSVSDLLSVKSLKNLPRSPISLQVDPYTQALPGSLPYPLLNAFNKKVGGRYAGDKNLDGGNTIQYANSTTSAFLKIFDCALMKLNLNYRYLPILASDTARGNLMVDEMRKAIAEATSTISATTFTAQNIYSYVIETDLPMGSAKKTTIGDKQYYTEIQDVIYAMSIEYQLIFQSIALAFNQFNSHRLKMGEMIRMSWNRETPILNAFFGMLKKKSFLAVWDSLSMTLQGEYFDYDFMTQANMLGLVSSRRSEAMSDPLLEIQSNFNFPSTFVASVCTDATKTKVAAEVFNQASLTYSGMTLDTALRKLGQYMTATDTLHWARTYASNGVTDTGRFNAIKDCIDVVNYCATYTKTAFNDLRSVFDIMTRSGVNQWKKGLKLSIVKDTDMVISQNLVVDNIYSMTLAGCPDMKFNPTTKRWSAYTLWNMYTGIPEHDAYSGGAFLSFSTKRYDTSDSTDTNIGYLPVAFTVAKSSTVETPLVAVVNRLGLRVALTCSPIQMSADRRLARLVPLKSQTNYKINVPSIAGSETGTFDSFAYSFIYRFMQQVFGLGQIPADTGSDIAIDSDTFAVYDYEVEDFTNEVINYCRSRGPFIASSVDSSNLGFFGLVGSN